MGDELTVVEQLLALQAEVQLRRDHAPDPAIARAYSMSITALEDARIRYTEARARELGVFSPADLDRAVNPGDYLHQRDQRADEAAVQEQKIHRDQLGIGDEIG